MKKIILTSAVAVALLAACKTSKAPETTVAAPVKAALDCSSATATYAGDIKAIFEANCNGCHGNRAPGGYNFTNLDDIKRAAGKGELMGTIKWEKGFPKMPARAGQLDQATISKIECWITNGMK